MSAGGAQCVISYISQQTLITFDPRQLPEPTTQDKADPSWNVNADCGIATGWLIQFFLKLNEFTVAKLLDSDVNYLD